MDVGSDTKNLNTEKIIILCLFIIIFQLNNWWRTDVCVVNACCEAEVTRADEAGAGGVGGEAVLTRTLRPAVRDQDRVRGLAAWLDGVLGEFRKIF